MRTEAPKKLVYNVAYAGEAGIKPDTPYRLNDVGEFVEVVG